MYSNVAFTARISPTGCHCDHAVAMSSKTTRETALAGQRPHASRACSTRSAARQLRSSTCAYFEPPNQRHDPAGDPCGRSRIARAPFGLSLGQVGLVAHLARAYHRPQGILSALGNELALFLAQCSEQVQHERVHVGAQLGHDERHAPGHQAADEHQVAAEPI